MNDKLWGLLCARRASLLHAQARLAQIRKTPELWHWTKVAELDFCEALDRAWEAQCMAQGSL